MKFEREQKNEIDKIIDESEKFCKAIEILDVVSATTLQRLFDIGYPTADTLLRNLLINGAVEQHEMFYKIVSKDKFANICQIYGFDKISPKFYVYLAK